MPPKRVVSFAHEPDQVIVEPSIFSLAVDEYVKSRSEKSKTPQFIKQIKESGCPDKEDVQKAMVQLERESTDKSATKNIRKVLRPVIRVLDDYSAIVDTMCSADPMPTALIWGSLRVVINSSKRFLSLYDTIKDQLASVMSHLGTLTEYEELFGESETMKELLKYSYIDIIRFWVRVDKECNRCVSNRLGRSLASFSTSKLDGIISDIGTNADRVSKLVPLVQERIMRGERENAAQERQEAGLAREEQAEFIKQQKEELRLRNIARKAERQKEVRTWIGGRASTLLNESNFRHREQNAARRSPGTCSWLTENVKFQNWINMETNTPNIWLRATPGAGKSVLCAYGTQEIDSNTKFCSIFQYYTFDEAFSALQVYRCLAEQLADKLWVHLGDMPEDIHEFTQRTAGSANREDVKTLIRMILIRLPGTFIFLDGLDEECDNGIRWNDMAETLTFITDLTSDTCLNVRLWCSSQDRTCFQSTLQKFEIIEVTKDINSTDIQSYLSKSIMQLDSLDLDPGYQTLILEDLRDKANGCFLWASLMLDSISKAATLKVVQTEVNDGLPRDYEKYYERKLKNIKGSDRAFVSKLLACIVFAKRPLRIDELCEAVAISSTPEGRNIDKSQRIFKSMILKLCEPLVQIQEVTGSHTYSTCTLTHASVHKFLVKNPQIFNSSEDSRACPITNDTMAEVCLRYLRQPRYQMLLKGNGDTFMDCTGEDFMHHHILTYAAKYWDKHLDDVLYTPEMYERVRKFTVSSQFQTCLQVQSLFVQGQFQFWYAAQRPWAGPQIRRVFPRWIPEDCGNTLESDYMFFVGEWGHLLDQITCLGGAHEGEIDLCFWAALGPQNFLRKFWSRYKSFMFDDGAKDGDDVTPLRYYESIDETGQILLAVTLNNLGSQISKLRFRIQKWKLTSGRSPKLQSTQFVETSRSNWDLYDRPPKLPIPGRPAAVSFTPDLQVLRIGSEIFPQSSKGTWAPIKIFDDEDQYFEDIASSGNHLALSTRQPVSRDDLFSAEEEETEIQDYSEYLLKKLQQGINSRDESAQASSAPTTTHDTTTQTSQSEASSSKSSVSSIDSEDDEDREKDEEKLDDEDEDEEEVEDYRSQISESATDPLEEAFKTTDESSDGNSAEMSWSEGSTEHSSEDEDEDQWNDWGNENLDLDDVDLSADVQFTDSDSGDQSELDLSKLSDLSDLDTDGDSESETDVKVSGIPSLKLKRPDTQTQEYSSDSSSVESHYSTSDCSNDSDDELDSETEQAIRLDDMIFGKLNKETGTKRVRVTVFDRLTPSTKPLFHYSQLVNQPLYQSPPVFHPSKPLLVWPLGGNEILFANYTSNTYFTRQLSYSGSKSCFIFIKTHFSNSGEFIHFAALEGRSEEEEEEDTTSAKKEKLHLSLQVSTHRLSAQKTARSPPRLLFKTVVHLDSVSSISVSRLPFTLTWTDEELFLTTRRKTLDVIRIPLFRKSETNSAKVCYLQNTIHLPRTAESRDVYYFPSRGGGKKDKEDQATVIIGSHSSMPSKSLLVTKNQVSPPIGVYLRENSDLGGWKCQINQGPKQKESNRAGRLQGKFESFDRKEDCDIVPYLF